MAINGVAGGVGYSQPYVSPASQAGTTQRTDNDPNAQANAAAEEKRNEAAQVAAGGNTTETRGQNLNIVV